MDKIAINARLEVLKKQAQTNFDILWEAGVVWNKPYNALQKPIMLEVRKLRDQMEPAEKVAQALADMSDADLQKLLEARKAAKKGK
jgi:hypothetical protein